MSAPVDEALQAAGRDPEVVAEAKAMILDVIAAARHTLEFGDPPSRQAVMRMFATPIVKEVLSPTKDSDENDQAALVERFHELRRAANQ